MTESDKTFTYNSYSRQYTWDINLAKAQKKISLHTELQAILRTEY